MTGSGRVDAAAQGLSWAGDTAALADLLDESDVVVVSAPLNEATVGMIGADQLRALGSDGVLVNVGRGAPVDERALYEALRSGTIRAAAIDVWYHYPAHGGRAAPSALPFDELSNVLMTPHSSGITSDTFIGRADDIAVNVGRLARGEILHNLVALARWVCTVRVMNRYRYCVVGAGIVGLSTAHHLLAAEPDASVVVLEAADSVAAHQTGHNSGVIHSGIYYEPGSLKARFCKAGERATKDFCGEHGIAFDECGKLIVATSAAELARMAALEERAAVNGITCRRVDRDELIDLEPNVTGLGALHLPKTGIVDYRLVSRTLVDLIIGAGGTVQTSQRVVAIRETAAGVSVSTDSQTFSCDRLVVCGGLQADRLAELAGVHTDVQVIPFRGEYFQLPGARAGFVKRLIYPVPDPELPFLGVHLSPTITGAITLGPSAVLGLAREGYPKFSVNPRDVARMAAFPGLWHVARANVRLGIKEIRNSLSKRAYLSECRKYAPGLTKADLLPHVAGIRAQAVRRDGTLVHDFVVERTDRMIHVLNSPSPAATAALPIGEHLAGLATQSDQATAS